MSKHIIAFNADEVLAATVEVKKLAKALQGRKLEEGDWTALYCRVKRAPDRGWSNPERVNNNETAGRRD